MSQSQEMRTVFREGWRSGLTPRITRLAHRSAAICPLDNSHRILNAFFNIDRKKIGSNAGLDQQEDMRLLEDNDPTKRLLAVIDNCADIGEYVEFSDEG